MVWVAGRSDGGPSADEAIAAARAEAQAAAADAEEDSEGAAAEGKAQRLFESCVTPPRSGQQNCFGAA